MSASREKDMGINDADVAELVDARDLKFVPTSETAKLPCKTKTAEAIENDGIRRDLQNACDGRRTYESAA